MHDSTQQWHDPKWEVSSKQFFLVRLLTLLRLMVIFRHFSSNSCQVLSYFHALWIFQARAHLATDRQTGRHTLPEFVNNSSSKVEDIICEVCISWRWWAGRQRGLVAQQHISSQQLIHQVVKYFCLIVVPVWSCRVLRRHLLFTTIQPTLLLLLLLLLLQWTAWCNSH